jgi:hypothetical protein
VLVVEQAGLGAGFTLHAPDMHVATASHATSGSLPYSHSTSPEQLDPAAGTEAGHGPPDKGLPSPAPPSFERSEVAPPHPTTTAATIRPAGKVLMQGLRARCVPTLFSSISAG